MKNQSKHLIIGASGQIGFSFLQLRYVTYMALLQLWQVILKNRVKNYLHKALLSRLMPPIMIKFFSIVKRHNIDTVYLMAAMLSVNAEKRPQKAWDLNMTSLFHVLNLAKLGHIKTGVLAFKYCGIWAIIPKNKCSTTYYYGTFYSVWYIKTCR